MPKIANLNSTKNILSSWVGMLVSNRYGTQLIRSRVTRAGNVRVTRAGNVRVTRTGETIRVNPSMKVIKA